MVLGKWTAPEGETVTGTGTEENIVLDKLNALKVSDTKYAGYVYVIANYKEEKRTISSFSISSASDVDYQEMDGYKWAHLMAVYTIKTNHTFSTSKEEYLLRKDAQGHWKIYGWRVIEEEEQ